MKRLLQTLIPDTHPLRLAYHRLRGRVAAWRAGYPARNLTVIAVTGTDGKTTTVAMIAHILRTARIPVAAVSTAFFEILGKRTANPTQKTSVGAATLQSFLRKAVDSGVTHAVVEASSHGLLQGRLTGIIPTVAAITNVTMEHLDYHGSMDAYIAAKALLFRAMGGRGTKVLNEDDQSFPGLSRIPSARTLTYSPKKQLSAVVGDFESTAATLAMDGGEYRIELTIPGAHNLENALCAVRCAGAVGISPQESIHALKTFTGAGGRMESIDAGQPFRVFIDFTVTPAAYERTLESARRIANGHRLLVLTGSCGDRMREKRPMVGKLCALLADVTIVTNEDPYTEDPETIIDDVLAGVPGDVARFNGAASAPTKLNQMNKFCVRISDRLEAIRYILSLASPGDVVLLCGKGADVTMMTRRGQIAWVEREIVLEELRAMSGER